MFYQEEEFEEDFEGKEKFEGVIEFEEEDVEKKSLRMGSLKRRNSSLRGGF